MPTQVYRLADRSLNGNLRNELESARDDGLSFRDIAIQLEAAHGIAVSHETVRRWCRDLGIEPERVA